MSSIRTAVLFTLVVTALTVPIAAEAAPILFDNGTVNDNDGASGYCDSGPGTCGGTWTYYDNFLLASNSTVTGFDYTDFFFSGGTGNYVQTSWSLWSTTPSIVGSPIASGTSVASIQSLALPDSPYLFTVSGLNIALTSGTQYWLGISNVTTQGSITTAARVNPQSGALLGAMQFDTAGNVGGGTADRAFRVYGETANATPVPEPASLLLMGSGIAGIAAKVRQRRKQQAR